jgi:TRAP-type C4-dicarboxylate transport system permease small subunit
MRAYQKTLEVFATLSGYLSALLMAAICVAVSCGVFSRYILNDPWQWTEETARILFVWVVFVAASVAVRRGLHFRFTLLLDSIGPKPRGALEILSNVWVIFFSSIMLVRGASFAILNLKQLTPSLVIPWGWVYVSVPISGALMILYSLEHIRIATNTMWKEGRA